jgi:hypothetical protein
MTYDVGTHIDLSHLNGTHQAAEVLQPRQQKESRLYDTGTRILFIKMVEGLTVLKITPTTIAYLQPAGA